ncbi:MAG: LysR family transcriptional regulator [Verrucomicrobiaceae bacterium]|nr:LysR family transcriptional regulator [Verrucomicrobiaceae bacterium]
MEFQQLEQFVEVARAGSFTRAAKELNLSQSALSRSIR